MSPIRDALTNAVLNFQDSEESVHRRLGEIQRDLLAQSRYIHDLNFNAIHPDDLKSLFTAYDDRFFTGRCAAALDGRHLAFRLSSRMTRAGGSTARYRSRVTGEVSYEITVATGMLFDGFRGDDREISVAGLPCANRLEALQRIFEHELVHLMEYLCWDTSNCSAARFQDIARRHFLHRGHTHQMITRRERAAESGIHPGARVTFEFEGRRLTGHVRRVTKRATILVEDPDGLPYTNGRRYRTYYVPLTGLKPVQ